MIALKNSAMTFIYLACDTLNYFLYLKQSNKTIFIYNSIHFFIVYCDNEKENLMLRNFV